MTGVGWIHTFEGRVGICVALIILGTILTVVLSVIRFVLHKQTAREFFVGFLVLGSLCGAPFLLALITVTSIELVHSAPVWIWIALAVAVVSTLVAVRILRPKRAQWRPYAPATQQDQLSHADHVHMPMNESGWQHYRDPS